MNLREVMTKKFQGSEINWLDSRVECIDLDLF
jgi:hypothetical protein